jgi:predicted Zn finger-like uncharacterized protein
LTPSQTRMIAYFSCPHCATVYTASQEQLPGQHRGDFCRRCGAPVHEWTGLYNFTDWKPVTTITRRKGTASDVGRAPALGHRSLNRSGKTAQGLSFKAACEQSGQMPQSGRHPPHRSRHFGRRPTTSGLPLETDIVRAGRHVSKVPIGDISLLRVGRRPRASSAVGAVSLGRAADALSIGESASPPRELNT